jgi:hypothetical protein
LATIWPTKDRDLVKRASSCPAISESTPKSGFFFAPPGCSTEVAYSAWSVLVLTKPSVPKPLKENCGIAASCAHVAQGAANAIATATAIRFFFKVRSGCCTGDRDLRGGTAERHVTHGTSCMPCAFQLQRVGHYSFTAPVMPDT